MSLLPHYAWRDKKRLTYSFYHFLVLFAIIYNTYDIEYSTPIRSFNPYSIFPLWTSLTLNPNSLQNPPWKNLIVPTFLQFQKLPVSIPKPGPFNHAKPQNLPSYSPIRIELPAHLENPLTLPNYQQKKILQLLVILHSTQGQQAVTLVTYQSTIWTCPQITFKLP